MTSCIFLNPGYSPGSERTCVAATPLVSLWCEHALMRPTFQSWGVQSRWCGIREEGEAFGACTEGIIHTLVHCMLEETHWAYELGFIRSGHKAMPVTAGAQTLCNHTAWDSQATTNTHIHSKIHIHLNLHISYYSYCGMKTVCLKVWWFNMFLQSVMTIRSFFNLIGW